MNKNVDYEQKEFFISQIKNTKEIIKTFSNTEEFSPTMLLNSLLSLVVLPFEKSKNKDREKIFPGSYKDLINRFGVAPQIFQPIKSCNDKGPNYSNKTIYTFVNKLRNGIAHQNLSVRVDENKEIFITIFNKCPFKQCKGCKNKQCKEKGLSYSQSGVVDFKIEVTVGQLQKIALYIADSYLKAIKG